MSIGAFVMTIGVISLVLLWIFNALRKDKKKVKDKTPLIAKLLVATFALGGIALLVMKNNFGYFFIVCSLIMCTILDKISINSIIALMSLCFGAGFMKVDRVTGVCLIILSVLYWIYVWAKPTWKECDKKGRLKLLIPVIISFLFFTSGLLIMLYVSNQTAALNYCWGV
jgi:hypothetical protein